MFSELKECVNGQEGEEEEGINPTCRLCQETQIDSSDHWPAGIVTSWEEHVDMQLLMQVCSALRVLLLVAVAMLAVKKTHVL